MIDKNFKTREFYHHGTPIENVKYGILHSDVKYTTDENHKLSNLWIKSIVGYYPTFIAYGNDYEVFLATGYENQFARVESYSSQGNVLRKKGEVSNIVHFSFQNLENLTYMDFLAWFGPLNEFITIKTSSDFERVTKKWKKHVFKPSYSESGWRRMAKNDPGAVMAVVPFLDLTTATTIYTRNRGTKKALESIGFESQIIKVERAKVYRFGKD